jgi:serine/threonine-protein kinase SRPK3
VAVCLQALDFLHRKCQIIHTDLKPENILLELPLEIDAEILAVKPGCSNHSHRAVVGSTATGGKHGGGATRKRESKAECKAGGGPMTAEQKKKLKKKMKKKQQKARKRVRRSATGPGPTVGVLVLFLTDVYRTLWFIA